MFAKMIAVMALAGSGSRATDQAEVAAAMATLQRATERADFAAAMDRVQKLADLVTQPDATAAAARDRGRFEALLRNVVASNRRLAAGRVGAAELFNVLQVVRDLIDAGERLSASPEDALCWQRAGLDLAQAHFNLARRRVAAGEWPPQQLDQTAAQVELFRAHYRQAVARCVPPGK